MKFLREYLYLYNKERKGKSAKNSRKNKSKILFKSQHGYRKEIRKSYFTNKKGMRIVPICHVWRPETKFGVCIAQHNTKEPKPKGIRALLSPSSWLQNTKVNERARKGLHKDAYVCKIKSEASKHNKVAPFFKGGWATY